MPSSCLIFKMDRKDITLFLNMVESNFIKGFDDFADSYTIKISEWEKMRELFEK